MIKKFENFINESVDSYFNFKKLDRHDLQLLMDQIRLGKKSPIFFRCHWAVAGYYLPNKLNHLTKDYKYELIHCLNLENGKEDELKEILSKPGKLFYIDCIDRTVNSPYYSIILAKCLENKDSIFVISTDQEVDEDFWNEMLDEKDRFTKKDRFTNIYKIL